MFTICCCSGVSLTRILCFFALVTTWQAKPSQFLCFEYGFRITWVRHRSCGYSLKSNPCWRWVNVCHIEKCKANKDNKCRWYELTTHICRCFIIGGTISTELFSLITVHRIRKHTLADWIPNIALIHFTRTNPLSSIGMEILLILSIFVVCFHSTPS